MRSVHIYERFHVFEHDSLRLFSCSCVHLSFFEWMHGRKCVSVTDLRGPFNDSYL